MEPVSGVSTDVITGDIKSSVTEVEQLESNETVAQGVTKDADGKPETLSYHFSKLDIGEQIEKIVQQGSDLGEIQRSNSYEEQTDLDSAETKIRRSKRRSRSSISDEDDLKITTSSEALRGKDVMRFTPYSTDHTKSGVAQSKQKSIIKEDLLYSASASADLTDLISRLSPTKSTVEASGFQESGACCKEPVTTFQDFHPKRASHGEKGQKRDKGKKQYKTEQQMSQKKFETSGEGMRVSSIMVDTRGTEHSDSSTVQ